jgi:farnesyl diphosphate synthase
MTTPSPRAEFTARLDTVAAKIDALLDALLTERRETGEIARPARLLEAMRYAALSGGKRLRPFLVVETAALFGVAADRALLAGAALECVHCYSRIHDDLPAMDNDDLRRGQPTTHKAFDEATAILAGDALLTFAFDLMAREAAHPKPAVRLALVTELARAAGIGGMAGGQMLDLEAEGRFGTTGQLGEKDIAMLQAMKTGAMIGFACRAGAMLGEADEAAHAALDRYGRAIGQAFQIADDLLDLKGDAATVGKATGKDAAAGKATLPSALGRDLAIHRLETLVAEAEHSLAPFGDKAATLRAAAHFVAERKK